MTAPPSAAEVDPRAAAVARLPPRIAFLGFGLIGGSIAMALREAGYAGVISAWTPERAGPEGGVRRGFVDEAASSAAAAIDGAGLVVLAGPPLAVSAILSDPDPALRSAAASGATITDVASTKGVIVGNAESGAVPFVGGHPMAGRDTAGVESALANLFIDRPWVVVPARTAREADVERVAALAGAVGARPIRMTAEAHDAAVAAISHLPLVAAAALVEAVALATNGTDDWQVARAIAATGWSDMTRLARGDPEMGAGILDTNRAAVTARLRGYRDAIDSWLQLLEADAEHPGAAGDIRSRLEAARDALGGASR